MSTNDHDFDQLFQLMTDTRKLMLEQFNKIDQRFESIDRRFDNVDKRLESIETNQKEHNRRIGNLESAQIDTSVRLSKIEETHQKTADALHTKWVHLFEMTDYPWKMTE